LGGGGGDVKRGVQPAFSPFPPPPPPPPFPPPPPPTHTHARTRCEQVLDSLDRQEAAWVRCLADAVEEDWQVVVVVELFQ